MAAILRLEIIGGDTPKNVRFWQRLGLRGDDLRRELFPEPWVAEILDIGKPVRLQGTCDYSEATPTGTRGVFKTFILHPGKTYMVSERLSWCEERRYKCRVNGFTIEEIK